MTDDYSLTLTTQESSVGALEGVYRFFRSGKELEVGRRWVFKVCDAVERIGSKQSVVLNDEQQEYLMRLMTGRKTPRRIIVKSQVLY